MRLIGSLAQTVSEGFATAVYRSDFGWIFVDRPLLRSVLSPGIDSGRAGLVTLAVGANGTMFAEIVTAGLDGAELELQIEKLALSNDTREKRLLNLQDNKEGIAERVILLEDKLA